VPCELLGTFPSYYLTPLARFLSTPSHILAGARAAAATAVDSPRRRAPRPNSGCAQLLGEHARTPPPFPGRESRRSRRNPGEPAASHSQGPNCKARDLSREFCVNEGPIRESLVLSRGFGASWIFNSVADLQKLVKCVEHRRNFRKLQNQFCWIRCEESYNFSYTHLVWFWIFLTWKIGMWKTYICYNSKTINPLHPNFGYVVHVMTSSCAKSCTKLCSKSFYINCFTIMQNLPRWFL
jgi:hypothetical protein